MFRSLKTAAAALAAIGLLAGASSAVGSVLYDNGALNGALGNFNIGGNGGQYAISNSFVLNTASTITGIQFGTWTFPGDTISTVDWGITTNPNAFSGFLDGGTATVVNGTTSLNSLGWAVGVDQIGTGPISLAAGVYYLVLQNAVAANPVYWDETDGLASAWSNALGSLQNYNSQNTTGSESFQILGTNGGEIPEPAAWTLMLVGLAGLGAVLRRARRPPFGTPAADPAVQPSSAILSR
jgi:hypothetical protein